MANALTGRLVGDFSSFVEAVADAEARLTSFATGANKVEGALLRMTDSFSGKKVIQEATLMVQAVENLGGVSQLTESELRRVQTSIENATAKMKALGMEVPESFRKIGDEADKMVPKAQGAESAFSKLGVAIGTFVGNFAYNLVQQGISSVINLGKGALETAGHVADLSEKLGISVEAVQGFQYAAEQSGTTIDAFGSAITKLNLTVGTGATKTKEALRDLGLSFETVRAMSSEDRFLAVADALARITDQAELTRLGTILMGKGFTDIIPAIKAGLRDTSASIAKFSEDEIKALDEAGDAWGRWYTKLKVWTGQAMVRAEEAGSWIYRQMMVNPKLRGGELDTTDLTNQFNQQFKPPTPPPFAPPPHDEAAAAEARERAAKAAAAAARALAEAEKAAATALAATTAHVEKQRAALEGLGLVTESRVLKQLDEMAVLQEQAAADGADHDRVLVALLPKLDKLAKQAKASGVEVGALAKAQRDAMAAWERLNPAIDDSVQGYVDLATVLPLTKAQAEQLNAVMDPDVWNAAKAEEAMTRMGITSRDELRRTAEQAEQDYAAIVASVGTHAPEAVEAYRQMVEAQKLASGELPTYWETNILPAITSAIDGISRAMSDTFAGMLTGAVGFKDGFVSIWESIKQSLQSILSEMLDYFVSGFLKGMIGSMLGQQGAFGKAFGGLFGGGGGGIGDLLGGLGGLFGGGGGAGVVIDSAPNIATSAGMSGALGIGGGAGGAGGGFMGSMGAFLTNPWTAGIAGAAALGMGIWKGGLFRGGEEALKVNPARDDFFEKFVNQYAGQFSAYESLVKNLTEGGVSHAQTEKLIGQIYAADSMKEFETAVDHVNDALAEAAVAQEAATTALEQDALAPKFTLLETSLTAADAALGLLTPTVDLGTTGFTTLNTTVSDADLALKKWTAQLNEPPYARGLQVTIAAGAINVVAPEKSAHELAQELASSIVSVILRENPNGARTQLQQGLATA